MSDEFKVLGRGFLKVAMQGFKIQNFRKGSALPFYDST